MTISPIQSLLNQLIKHSFERPLLAAFIAHLQAFKLIECTRNIPTIGAYFLKDTLPSEYLFD